MHLSWCRIPEHEAQPNDFQSETISAHCISWKHIFIFLAFDSNISEPMSSSVSIQHHVLCIMFHVVLPSTRPIILLALPVCLPTNCQYLFFQQIQETFISEYSNRCNKWLNSSLMDGISLTFSSEWMNEWMNGTGQLKVSKLETTIEYTKTMKNNFINNDETRERTPDDRRTTQSIHTIQTLNIDYGSWSSVV